MGAPGVELPRGTTRPACGVAQTVPTGHSYATFRPRPICGSDFYAVLLISATFNDSGLYELRGEYLSPLGLKTRINIAWLPMELTHLLTNFTPFALWLKSPQQTLRQSSATTLKNWLLLKPLYPKA